MYNAHEGRFAMSLFTETRDHLKNGGSSVSTLLTCVGSYFSSTHRTLCWVLFGLGALFLLITIYTQINRKTKTALPIHALTAFSVLVLLVVGFTDLNRKPSRQAVPAAQQVEPTNTAPVSTTGDNAPAIGAGNGNTVTYATPAEPERKPKKK